MQIYHKQIYKLYMKHVIITNMETVQSSEIIADKLKKARICSSENCELYNIQFLILARCNHIFEGRDISSFQCFLFKVYLHSY
jgi:hypothetical protein